MNPLALLGLLGDLYAQVEALQRELVTVQARNAELEAQLAAHAPEPSAEEAGAGESL